MFTEGVGGQSWVRKANSLGKCMVSALYRFLGVVMLIIFPYEMNIKIFEREDWEFDSKGNE